MVRLIPAPLELHFSEFIGQEEMRREFESLSQSDNDPVGEWLRMAKARGETQESDPVLIELILAMHRKMDELKAIVTGEKEKRIELNKSVLIEGIGYEHFGVKSGVFEEDKEYYGRILMPIFPQREIGIFFKAIDDKLAFISLIHERDEKDWSAYLTARERIQIRQMRGKNAK